MQGLFLTVSAFLSFLFFCLFPRNTSTARCLNGVWCPPCPSAAPAPNHSFTLSLGCRAPLIDYWVIGVDDANTDATPEVIQRHLGHIPGRIVTVHFDGMGPTWSQLVDAGVEHYPEATHGILADADFAPRHASLDKMELDIGCSKILYKVYSESNAYRKLDWIYRNVRGAKVLRRTHQSLHVPPLPEQHWHVCEAASFEFTERTGGFQDRSGGNVAKQRRYVRWLEKDLEEMPNDSRTTYYLGMQNLQLYEALMNEEGVQDKAVLAQALKFLKQRASGRVASTEDRRGREEGQFWAIIKVAEVLHAYYNTPVEEVLEWYQHAADLDPARAEPLVHSGGVLRAAGRTPEAIPYYYKAAGLPFPDRALFHNREMYDCFAKTELANAVASVGTSDSHLNLQLLKDAVRWANHVLDVCPQEPYDARLNKAMPFVHQRLQVYRDMAAVDGKVKRPAATRPPQPQPLANPRRRPRRQLQPFRGVAGDAAYLDTVPSLARDDAPPAQVPAQRERTADVRPLQDAPLDAAGASDDHQATSHLQTQLASQLAAVVAAVDLPGTASIMASLDSVTDVTTRRPVSEMWPKYVRQLRLAAEVPGATCDGVGGAIVSFVEFVRENSGAMEAALLAKREELVWDDVDEAAADLAPLCPDN